MLPTWLDVLLVPNAEFLIEVGNISAVCTAKFKKNALDKKRMIEFH